MENSDCWELSVTYPECGTDEITEVRYENEKVFINDRQYFGNVSPVAWNLFIGGYQPARKWLKDRIGRNSHSRTFATIKNHLCTLPHRCPDAYGTEYRKILNPYQYEQLHFPKSGQVDLRQRLHRQAGERDSGRQEDHGYFRRRLRQEKRRVRPGGRSAQRPRLRRVLGHRA